MDWLEGHRDTDPHLTLASRQSPPAPLQWLVDNIDITETIKSMSLVFAATWQLLFCPLLGMLIVFS